MRLGVLVPPSHHVTGCHLCWCILGSSEHAAGILATSRCGFYSDLQSLNGGRRGGYMVTAVAGSLGMADPYVWSGRASQEGFVDLSALRSCINVSGL